MESLAFKSGDSVIEKLINLGLIFVFSKNVGYL